MEAFYGYCMSNPSLFSQHFLDCPFQLLVVAIDIILWSVVHFDVRIELCAVSYTHLTLPTTERV